MRISSSISTRSRARTAVRGRPASRPRIRSRLENSHMEEIFQTGLHEFIGGFIADNNRLGALITEQYLL